MDLTPHIPADRQVIESYGRGGFRVSGINHAGAVIVFPETTVAWAPVSVLEITAESLAAVSARAGTEQAVEILLIGCGARMVPLPQGLRAALRANGVAIEPMDTGAACRTYDVLMAEGRRVAAALLPPA
jgi:uncharacterized protein